MCTGETCAKCESGFYTTYKTVAGVEYRKRHLRCNQCGHKPENNEIAIPLRFAPRRKPRLSNLPVEQKRIF